MQHSFKKFDYFGVELNFLYDSKTQYYSSTGGIIFILFFLVSITYILCNIEPFIHRKNMTLIFYDKKIEQTDEIDLENFTSRFAFGFTCDGHPNRTYVESLFKISVNHVTMNSTEGKRVKTKKTLEYANCEKKDFYNEFNSSYETNGFEKVYCPNESNLIMSGIYQDPIFRYYEIGININDDNDHVIVDDILHNYECRLAIHHVDTTVNVYDYHDPVKRFISTEFITLKSNLLTKMNIYFKMQSFDSYENLLFDTYHAKYYIGFSSFEQYDGDKGYDRFITKPIDYNIFGKIYIRSALERTLIQRKYMKLTEFAANMSSILSEILLILFASVRYINRFYSQQSIITSLFHFKNEINMTKGKSKTNIANQLKDKINNNNNYSSKYDNSPVHLGTDNIITIDKTINFSTSGLFKKTVSPSHSSELLYKIRQTSTVNNYKKMNHHSQVQFHIFEIILFLFFPCCSTKSFNIRKALYEKGLKKLSFQLDVLTYLKKMFQLELMSYALLDYNMNQMIHCLSKPSISLNDTKDIFDYLTLQYATDISKKEKEEVDKYVIYLNEKTNKTFIEKKLLEIAKNKL